MKPRRLSMVGAFVAVCLAGALLTGCDTPADVLAGNVTVASSGQPAAGIPVTAYANGSESVVATAATDAAGHYAFTTSDLADGNYRIRFGPSDWWNNASDWATATPVSVAASTPATIDDAVAAGSISGTAYSPTGSLGSVTVTAINVATERTTATTQTAADGTYSMLGVPVGDYRLRFAKSGFTTRYSDSTVHWADAPAITVTYAANTTGIDTTLATESTLTGKVTGNGPVSGAAVLAVDPTDGRTLAVTSTQGDGSFTLSGLNPIPTAIRVVAAGYLPQFRGSDDGTLAQADTISPPAGDSRYTGILRLIGDGCTPATLAKSDLSNANLVNCDLTGRDLAGADLSGADLTGANLSRVHSGAVTGTPAALPDGWKLLDGYLVGYGADLSGADLTGIDFSGADLRSTDLSGADLAGVDLTGQSLISSILTGANLQGTGLASADLSYVRSGGITGVPATLNGYWRLIRGYLVGPGANLTGADLHGADLSNANLRLARLTDALLTSANFVDADLTDATLTGADLGGANLYRATLDGVTSGGITGTPGAMPSGWSLVGGYLIGHGVDLGNVDLHGLDLSGMDLSGSDLRCADLTDADLTSADLTDANFTCLPGPPWGTQRTLLVGTDFTNANLTRVMMYGSDVSGAIFTGANLDALHSGVVDGVPAALPANWAILADHFVGPGADLSHGDLSQTDLSGADFSGADLSYAKLTGSSLEGADLSGTTLTHARSGGLTGTPAALPADWMIVNGYLVGPGAYLRGVDFTDADLSGADLDGADLTDVVLTGATLDNIHASGIVGTPAALPTGWRFANSRLIGSGAHLAGANLSNLDLSGVDLHGADLTETNLINANLSGADLSATTLVSASLGYSDLTAANLTGAVLTHVYSSGITGTPSSLPVNWSLVHGYLMGPGAYLGAADLTGVDLSGVDLTDGHLLNATLTDTNLDGTNLTGANLAGVSSGGISGTPAGLPSGWEVRSGFLVGPGADLSYSNLSGMDLTGADLSGTNFVYTNLTNAILTNANLDGAILAQPDSHSSWGDATLTGVTSGGITGTPATLPTGWKLANGYLVGPGAHLAGADLSNTDLAGIDFSNTDLENTDFSGANLSSVRFYRATLTGTVLTGATMYRVSSGGVVGTPAALPSDWVIRKGYLLGPSAVIFGPYLNGADFSGVDLSGLNLAGAQCDSINLTGANLTGTDLTGAYLINAVFDSTNIDGTHLSGADFTGITSSGLVGTPASLPDGWSIVNGQFVQN